MRPGRYVDHAWAGGGGRSAAGFTVLEIVVVLSLLAILASAAAPRFFGRSGFDERFFVEEVRSALGHARAVAVATGCEVQVALGASGYALHQRAACTSGGFDRAVPDPGSGSGACAGAPPAGVALGSSVDPIVFDTLGRARTASGIVSDATIGIGSSTLVASGETGLVYTP